MRNGIGSEALVLILVRLGKEGVPVLVKAKKYLCLFGITSFHNFLK